jgi:ADP-ribosylglycohydrolase
MREFREKSSGCLAGVAIGDALGAPVEIYSCEQIVAMIDGGITDFADLFRVKRKVDVNLPFNVGDTTDDWAFTEALAQSMLFYGHYNHLDVAQRFVALYGKAIGMGGTTKASLQALNVFFTSLSVREKNDLLTWDHTRIVDTLAKPVAELGEHGAGSGVAMRIAPLAIYYSVKYLNGKHLDYNFLYDFTAQHAGITHLNKTAILSGFTCFCALLEILTEDLIIDDLYSGRSFIKSILAMIKPFGSNAIYEQNSVEGSIVKNLEFVVANLGDLKALRNRFCSGKSAFLGANIVSFSLAVFARNGSSFERGVLEAVNSGGDTDTVASITGGFLGAKLGLQHIPQKWLMFSSKFLEASQIGRRLSLLK